MKSTVEELRKKLMDEYRYTKEDVNKIKGRKDLEAKLEELAQEDDDFDKAQMETENYGNAIVIEDDVDYLSEEWVDHVMGQFTDKELNNGNPTVPGLRRVAEKLLGPIVNSGPTQVFPSITEEIGRATVVFQVEFSPWIPGHEGQKRMFSAVADSCFANTNDEFAIFPVAMAETRAEGRVLRRALKIKKVANEELTSKDLDVSLFNEKRKPEEASFGENEYISYVQINFIKTKCQQLGIDVNLFINSGEKPYDKIEEIKYETALSMIERINQYQSSATDSPKIPIEILDSVK